MKKFTILIAAIALVCFSVPAMAADWNFYGSARMQTTYFSDDFDDTLNTCISVKKMKNIRQLGGARHPKRLVRVYFCWEGGEVSEITAQIKNC